MTILMLAIFFALLVLAFPVGYALIVSSGIAAVTAGGMPSATVVVKIFQPSQSFPLLAIPFFVLSGNLMMGGTLGKKLIEDYPETAEVTVELREELNLFSRNLPLIRCFTSEAVNEEDWELI